MNNRLPEISMPLHGILIQDPKDGGFTSILAEFPEVIAEGETEQEAHENLMAAFKSILAFKREEFDAENTYQGVHVKQQTFNFALK